MEIKTIKVIDNSTLPETLSEIFSHEEYCVVDIETTGLSGKYNKVILIGILYKFDKTIISKQLFAENPNEEIHILNEFANIFKNFSYIITYNGASFDIPFLKKRFQYHNIKWSFHNIKHIDILQFIRKEKDKLNLKNLQLKTVEKFLGINRTDTISGKDSILLYKQYVKHPCPSIKKTILLHNYEDIYYLNILLTIFNHISVDKYDLVGKDIVINNNNKKIIFNFYPKDISIKRNSLLINGQSSIYKDIFDLIHYDPNFSFQWYPNKGIFNIIIPILEGYLSTGEKCIYINLENFNLSKSDFKLNTYYKNKFFPNNLMILKYKDNFNIDLLGELFSIIFEFILRNS